MLNNSCNLYEQKQEDFMKLMNSFVMSSVKTKDNSQSSVISLLSKLKSQFDNTEDIIDSIQDYTNNKFNPYSAFISNDIKKYFNDTVFLRSQLQDTFENIPGLEELNNEQNKADNSPKGNVSYLNESFPSASSSQTYYTSWIKNKIALTMFVNDWDSDTSKLVGYHSNYNEEFNRGMYALKLKLINYIKEYFKDNTTITQAINNQLLGQDDISKIVDFDAAQTAIDNVITQVKPYLETLNKKTLIKIPSIMRSPESGDYNLARAYLAYTALTHFNDSVRDLFKGVINVDGNNYSVTFGDKNARSWSDQDEDRDQTAEIGSSIIAFFETLPAYRDNIKLDQNLRFSDVKTALGKIMDLFNTREESIYVAKELFDQFEDYYSKQQLAIIRSKFSGKHSIKDLIASTKQNTAEYLPILFAIIDNNREDLFNKQTSVQNTIHSMFKGLYDTNNDTSLINMIDNVDSYNPTLYGFVNTLFVNIENTPFMEYAEDTDGNISIQNIKENSTNASFKQLTNWLNSYYNKNSFWIKKQDDNIWKANTYTITKNGNSINIDFKDFNDNNIQLYGVQAQSDVIHYTLQFKDGGVIDNYDLNNISDFLSEVFQTDINSDFINQAKKTNSTKAILDLATNILYNAFIGKIMNVNTKTQFNDAKQSIYGSNTKIVTMFNSIQPQLIMPANYPNLIQFSNILDIVNQHTSDNTAKDAEGKQLSILGLSSLLPKIQEEWINYNDIHNPKSPLSGFTIYGAYRGSEYIRDYSGPSGVKSGRTFSPAEFYIASLCYDYNTKDKDGKPQDYRIMGPVVSDKNKLVKLKINPNYKVEVNGQTKPIVELTIQDIQWLATHEFGHYYQRVYDSIHDNLNIINQYLTVKGIPALNYDSNFKEFNDWAIQNNISNTFDIIHDAIVEAQQAVDENGVKKYPNLRIIEGITLNWSKADLPNGKKTKLLKNNSALYYQLNINGATPIPNYKTDQPDTRSTAADNFKRMNYQLISEIMHDVDIIDLTHNGSLRDNLKWIKKANESWYNKNNGRLGYARITYGDYNSSLITSKQDFANWNLYKAYRQSLFDPDSRTDVNSPSFDLGYTLQELNYFKTYFLISQESNILASNNKLQNIYEQYNGESIDRTFYRIYTSYLMGHGFTVEDAEEKAKNVVKNNGKFSTKEKRLAYILKHGAHEINIDYIDDNVVKLLNNYAQAKIDESEKPDMHYQKVLSMLNNNVDLRINPFIERHNLLNYWIGESYNLTSVGTLVSHPSKGNTGNTINSMLAAMFGQQVKRQVSQTAAKHREVQNNLSGIRDRLRIAIFEDVKGSAYTYSGFKDSAATTPYDGATFENGILRYLDNNSLGADAMGADKKPFVHFMDANTGIAIIVKTAGFVSTNERIRASEEMDGIMNYHMNNTIKWSETMRNKGINNAYLDWTKDYKGDTIDFGYTSNTGQRYIYLHDNKTGKWYKRFDFKVDDNGHTTFMQREVSKLVPDSNINADTKLITIIGQNEYDTLKKNGQDVSNYIVNTHNANGIIDSNWQLWKYVLGAEYSAHQDSDGKLSYDRDDSSFTNLVKIVNTTQFIKKAPKLYDSTQSGKQTYKLISQNDGLQVLKESMIDMCATAGAVKFGASNINSNRAYTDPNYKITYIEGNSADFGAQLDAEHKADDAHVSLMTQVLNALGARGYSENEAEEVYEALYNLAGESFKDAFDALNEFRNTKDDQAFREAAAVLIGQSITKVSPTDGGLLNALAQNVIALNNGTYTDEELYGKFPISNPTIFKKVISDLAGTLEKAVRLKMKGGMSVLNPSNGRFKIIDNNPSGYYKDHIDELINLQNKYLNNSLQLSDIKLGYNYYIKDKNGNFVDLYTGVQPNNGIDPVTNKLILINDEITGKPKEPINLIDSPADLYTLELRLAEGCTVYNAVAAKDVNGNYTIPKGHDLATYNCTVQSVEGTKYNLWQFDVVADLYTYDKDSNTFKPFNGNSYYNRFEEAYNSYKNGEEIPADSIVAEGLRRLGFGDVTHKPSDLSGQLLLTEQKELNAISNGLGNKVFIKGQEIQINKSKTKIEPYECILPMMYQTSFGLKDGDNLNNIIKDRTFFIIRSLNNLLKESTGIYDIKLNIVNGRDIKLKHDTQKYSSNNITSQMYLGASRYKEIPIATSLIDGQLYRVDPTDSNNVYYAIPYTIQNGKYVPNCKIFRKGKDEIIVTDDFTFFLNSLDYNNIQMNIDETDDKLVRHTIASIAKAKDNNQTAADKFDWIIKTYNIDDSNAETFSRDLNNLVSNPTLLRGLVSNQEQTIKQLIHNLNNNKLDDILKNKGTLEDKDYSEFMSLIHSGLEIHTSFLASLQSIISRTPAQSHQSFMTMQVKGFDNSGLNSAYVSRMQLFLQGSDYDIDKVSILGYVFRNGKFQKWSPYFRMNNMRDFEQSIKLPFPTNRELQFGETKLIPYDILNNNLTININDDKVIATDTSGYQMTAYQTEDGIWHFNVDNDIDNALAKYQVPRFLLRYALGDNTSIKVSMEDNDALGIISGIFSLSNINIPFDYDEFNKATDLATQIRVYNKLSVIPQNMIDADKIKQRIDKHNLFFQNSQKDKINALQNFVSVRMREISKDPKNLIQAQAGIDEQTKAIKNIVNSKKVRKILINMGLKGDALEKEVAKLTRLATTASSSDRSTVLSRMEMLQLTLSGKDNTGIVAAAMKTYEAISQYYYQVINHGTAEQQDSLLFNIEIAGQVFNTIANSQANNPFNVKSEKLREVLKNVNNIDDTFLVMSAFLSLSTDNAKDPVLAKLNAGPEMIGCYIAGIALGMKPIEVADLMLSDTGMVLKDLVSDNKFSDKKAFNRLDKAIRYLQQAPNVDYNALLKDNKVREIITNAFKTSGLFTPTKEHSSLTAKDIKAALNDYHNLRKLTKIFSFLNNAYEGSKVLNPTSTDIILGKIASLKNESDYQKWKKKGKDKYDKLISMESLNSSQKSQLSKLQKQLDAFNKIQAQIDAYNGLLKGESGHISEQNEVNKELDAYKNLNSEAAVKEIRRLNKGLRESGDTFVKDLSFKNTISDIMRWLNCKKVTNSDFVTDSEGRGHLVLNQINKLSQLNTEMSSLRQILSLNQGLDTTVEDQYNSLRNFEDIINKKKGNNKNDQLAALAALNGSENDTTVNLNRWLNDPHYNEVANRAYESIKFAINPLAILNGVKHYRGYLNIFNLLTQLGSIESAVYRDGLMLSTKYGNLMNIRDAKTGESFQKQIIPYLYTIINNNFLFQSNIQYKIPVIDQNGNVSKSDFEVIRLGQPKDNQKFKKYIEFVVFPMLQKEAPNNAFVKSITYKAYGFNLNHKQTINLAKRRAYDLSNIYDQVEFDQVKNDLAKLIDSRGIVTALYYYNMIAYNNQPGSNSLTDLFEDIIANNKLDVIKDYNYFVSNVDRSSESLIPKNDTINEIALAPVVSISQLSDLQVPYVYVLNPETQEYTLLKKVDNNQDEDIEYDENYVPTYFERQLSNSNYVQDTGEQKLPNLVTAQLTLGKYSVNNLVISDNGKIDDGFTVTIKGHPKSYTKEGLLSLAHNNGYNDATIEDIFPVERSIRKDGYSYYKVNPEKIKNQLDLITKKNNCG